MQTYEASIKEETALLRTAAKLLAAWPVQAPDVTNVGGITSDYEMTAFGAPLELDERFFDNPTKDAVQEYAEEDVFDFGGDMGDSAYYNQ